MVKVMPFKAYRPPPTIAASLAAPPYDVINSDEARKLADGNEYSFLRVRESATVPPQTPSSLYLLTQPHPVASHISHANDDEGR